MKISSYNATAGRRAKEKVHTVNEAFSLGRMHDGENFQRLPGASMHLYFDNRVYILEFREDEVKKLREALDRLNT